jgi:hypothetical protein
MDEAYNTPHDFMMRGGMSDEEQKQERLRIESLLKEFVQMGLTSSPEAVAIGFAWREAAESAKWLGGPKPNAELFAVSDKEKGGSSSSSKDPNPVSLWRGMRQVRIYVGHVVACSGFSIPDVPPLLESAVRTGRILQRKAATPATKPYGADAQGFFEMADKNVIPDYSRLLIEHIADIAAMSIPVVERT